MYATQEKDFRGYSYILGKPWEGMSIGVSRYWHLYNLNSYSGDALQLSVRDIQTNAWTKWKPFFDGWKPEELMCAYDVHRSVLKNEIVIESDYPTYEENYEAARFIGKLLEGKGLQPSYYYSGNKSLHVHILFDFKTFLDVPLELQEQVMSSFRGKGFFVNSFMKWLRERAITGWDTNIKQFDKDLVKPVHLIRSELSRNKQGYKTFLGNSYKDISCVPYICNETNRIYPILGDMHQSSINHAEKVLNEFLDNLGAKRTKSKNKRKEMSLSNWISPKEKKGLRKCVEFLMTEEFKEGRDGFNRAMFILANELKKEFGEAVAETMLFDWNDRMEANILPNEISYRVKQKEYNLTCNYIHEFLDGLGFSEVGLSCEGKL